MSRWLSLPRSESSLAILLQPLKSIVSEEIETHDANQVAKCIRDFQLEPFRRKLDHEKSIHPKRLRSKDTSTSTTDPKPKRRRTCKKPLDCTMNENTITEFDCNSHKRQQARVLDDTEQEITTNIDTDNVNNHEYGNEQNVHKDLERGLEHHFSTSDTSRAGPVDRVEDAQAETMSIGTTTLSPDSGSLGGQKSNITTDETRGEVSDSRIESAIPQRVHGWSSQKHAKRIPASTPTALMGSETGNEFATLLLDTMADTGPLPTVTAETEVETHVSLDKTILGDFRFIHQPTDPETFTISQDRLPVFGYDENSQDMEAFAISQDRLPVFGYDENNQDMEAFAISQDRLPVFGYDENSQDMEAFAISQDRLPVFGYDESIPDAGADLTLMVRNVWPYSHNMPLYEQSTDMTINLQS
jgi:hypothetical protein